MGHNVGNAQQYSGDQWQGSALQAGINALHLRQNLDDHESYYAQVMLGVVTFMIVKVLPQVQSIYAGLKGASLPLVTRVLLGVSHIMTHYWWLVLIILGLLIFF